MKIIIDKKMNFVLKLINVFKYYEKVKKKKRENIVLDLVYFNKFL